MLILLLFVLHLSFFRTIDNDVPQIDRTFGFESAVEAARDAINVANVEAEGFPQ